MHISTKFLIGAVVFLLLGFSDQFSEALNGLGRAIGAICVCLFLITRILQGEMKLYDEQQAEEGGSGH